MITIIIFLLALSGCILALDRAEKIDMPQFADTQPKLVIEDFFDGRVKGHGMVVDRFGTVQARFTADIRGEWDGTTLVLTEDFYYDDGTQEQRVWTLRKIGEHSYAGESNLKTPGIAHGQSLGQAYNMKYPLLIRNDSLTVQVDDWLFRVNEDTILNQAKMSKYGLKVAELLLVMQRVEEE